MVDWVQICSLEFSVGVKIHSECVTGIQKMEGGKVVSVSLDSCLLCWEGTLKEQEEIKKEVKKRERRKKGSNVREREREQEKEEES